MADNIVIDIEKIMDEIRADIAAKGFNEDLPDFADISVKYEPPPKFDIAKLESVIARLGVSWNIQPYHEIRSRPGVLGGIIIFIRRIIRRCITFHTTPIVSEQDEVNLLILEALVQLRDFVKDQSKAED
ncbi:MAG: hypothetical protein LBB94_06550 [Clostridiales bacterium]|jgi:hypothetical protein|nr:hypothetical protein [Clostridiales bacterium]